MFTQNVFQLQTFLEVIEIFVQFHCLEFVSKRLATKQLCIPAKRTVSEFSTGWTFVRCRLNVVEICHFRVNWNDILQYNWQYFRIHEANNFGNTIFIIFTHFMTDIYQVIVEGDNLAPYYWSKLKTAIPNKKQLSFTTYKPGWIFGRIRALKMLWSRKFFDCLTFQFLSFFSLFCLFVCLYFFALITLLFLSSIIFRARSSSYSRGTSY